MQYFYAPDLVPDMKTYQLSDEESGHALRVLRKKLGDSLTLLDGKGGIYNSEIIDTKGKKCKVAISDYSLQQPNREKKIHIAIAPTKNMDRTEWFVEKSVEIGVDEVSFLLTQHSERKVLKLDRIEKRAISAMKQSGNFYMPKINSLTKLEDFISEVKESGKFIAFVPANADDTLQKNMGVEDTCVLVGPEGGFSDEEVEMANRSGFKAVSLGKSRLRTETAGIVACHTLNICK